MVWVFQAIPSRFDLRTELVVGKTDTWLVTRFRDEMKPGDLVYFWLAGGERIRGLYGWGRVVGLQSRFFPQWGHGIDIEYRKVFPRQIRTEELVADTLLSQHELFGTSVGTNFRLTEGEHNSLKRIIEEFLGRGMVPP